MRILISAFIDDKSMATAMTSRWILWSIVYFLWGIDFIFMIVVLLIKMNQYKTAFAQKGNTVEIASINYDFLPTSHESSKSLWVVTRYPLGNALQPGTMVKLIPGD